MDVAHEGEKMRILESESLHMEPANEDGNNELNVALRRHDVKDLAFHFYSVGCLKLIYTLQPSDVCLLSIYWKDDHSLRRCFHAVTVLAKGG